MSVVEFGEGNDVVNDHEEEEHREEEHLKLVEDAEMQQSFTSFIDDLSIPHDDWPESDSDSEDEVAAERFSKAVQRGDANSLRQGQIYFSREVFEEAVLDYVLKTGRNIKKYRNGKTQIGYNCLGGNCEWRIYCGFKSKWDDWEVTVFNDRHSCVPNGECEMLTVPMIAKFFVHKIREEPEYYMPMKIEELIREKWKITVPTHQCQAARNMALEWIEREYDLQFERLRDYGAEILDSNPNTTVDIETLTNDEGLDVFNRFYVCFDCHRRSWKETCRPLISVDSYILRSKMKGQLLVALGRDADNAIYPIAWAVVLVENTVNWLWFVKKLKADLGLEGGAGYVLISDRPKELIRAVEQELPHIEHRMCVRHMYANLEEKHGKKPDMKPLVWRLALSYNEVEYKANLDRLLVCDRGVYEDVLNSNPVTWCRAFYKVGSRCEDVENNSTDSFDTTFFKAIEKPIVPMLEMIATLAMVRIYECSVKAIEHPGVITPYVQDLLALELPGASECRVYSGTDMIFQVLESKCYYQVNLESRTCSCRKWEIRGIPCQHGYAVILSKKYEVENFVSHYFTTEMWRRTYTEGITPLQGAKFWPRTGNPVYKPPSPSQPGRKKESKQEKRKKGTNESPTKKKKRTIHCGICGAANHNIRFHRKQRGQAEITQASHGEITQVSQGDVTQASQGQIIQTSD